MGKVSVRRFEYSLQSQMSSLSFTKTGKTEIKFIKKEILSWLFTVPQHLENILIYRGVPSKICELLTKNKGIYK